MYVIRVCLCVDGKDSLVDRLFGSQLKGSGLDFHVHRVPRLYPVVILVCVRVSESLTLITQRPRSVFLKRRL